MTNLNGTIAIIVAAFLSAVAFTSCASVQDTLNIGANEQAMNRAATVPGARGDLFSRDTDNGNTEVKVKVEHLAQPQDLEKAARTYVVWVQDSQRRDSARNLGALKVSDDLTGTLKAVTPMRRFDIFVTPEPIANAENPSGPHVLWSTVTR